MSRKVNQLLAIILSILLITSIVSPIAVASSPEYQDKSIKQPELAQQSQLAFTDNSTDNPPDTDQNILETQYSPVERIWLANESLSQLKASEENKHHVTEATNELAISLEHYDDVYRPVDRTSFDAQARALHSLSRATGSYHDEALNESAHEIFNASEQSAHVAINDAKHSLEHFGDEIDEPAQYQQVEQAIDDAEAALNRGESSVEGANQYELEREIRTHADAIDHYREAVHHTERALDTASEHTEPELFVTTTQPFEHNGSVKVGLEATVFGADATRFSTFDVASEENIVDTESLHTPGVDGHLATGMAQLELEPNDNVTLEVTTTDGDRTVTQETTVQTDERNVTTPPRDPDKSYDVNVSDDESGTVVNATGDGLGPDAVTVTNQSDSGDAEYRAAPMVRIENETAIDDASVTIPLDDDIESETDSLAMYTWDPTSDDSWSSIESEIDLEEQTATAEVDGFSFFSVFDTEQWDDFTTDVIVLEDRHFENSTYAGDNSLDKEATQALSESSIEPNVGESRIAHNTAENASDNLTEDTLSEERLTSTDSITSTEYDTVDDPLEYTVTVTDSDGTEVGSASVLDDHDPDEYGNHLNFRSIGDFVSDGDHGIVDYIRYGDGELIENFESGDFDNYTRTSDGGAESRIVSDLTSNGQYALELETGPQGTYYTSNDELIELESGTTIKGDIRHETDNSGSYAMRTGFEVGTEPDRSDGVAVRLTNPGTQRTEGLQLRTPNNESHVEFTPSLGEFYTVQIDIGDVESDDEPKTLLDSNNDGIPDAVTEMDLRIADGDDNVIGDPLELDPFSLDTSGDGRPDNETVDIDWEVIEEDNQTKLEAHLNHVESHPARVDTTGDGLPDQQQLDGWEIDIVDNHEDALELMEAVTEPDDERDPAQFFETRLVDSDPLVSDTSGNRLTDVEEFELGTNPRQSDTTDDGISDTQALSLDSEDPTVFTTTPPEATLLNYEQSSQWASFDRPRWHFSYTYQLEDEAGISSFEVLREGSSIDEETFSPPPTALTWNTQYESLWEGSMTALRGSETMVEASDIHGNVQDQLLHSQSSFYGELSQHGLDPNAAGTLSGFTHGASELPEFVMLVLSDPVGVYSSLTAFADELDPELVQ
ncbi:hypothetical protein G6M89_20185 [Natronolimnobius sp. AArcel1]|uniref:hypothetical protein n=1 Tax=Natronolimnobius sp. AArcel1 TaxID=1679093 RepID=UPI0013EC1B29|nr:hypothetical protein [Natronolimnobius sp. AArcel1]NGM71289.1 hypothetical protein [Natronolimnobius sp. AArcel1]